MGLSRCRALGSAGRPGSPGAMAGCRMRTSPARGRVLCPLTGVLGAICPSAGSAGGAGLRQHRVPHVRGAAWAPFVWPLCQERSPSGRQAHASAGPAEACRRRAAQPEPPLSPARPPRPRPPLPPGLAGTLAWGTAAARRSCETCGSGCSSEEGGALRFLETLGHQPAPLRGHGRICAGAAGGCLHTCARLTSLRTAGAVASAYPSHTRLNPLAHPHRPSPAPAPPGCCPTRRPAARRCSACRSRSSRPSCSPRVRAPCPGVGRDGMASVLPPPGVAPTVPAALVRGRTATCGAPLNRLTHWHAACCAGVSSAGMFEKSEMVDKALSLLE